MNVLRLLALALRPCTFARASILAAAAFTGIGLGTTAEAQSRQLWYRTYDGSTHAADSGRHLALGIHGETFVIGTSANAQDNDVLLLAYNGAGQLLWERRIDLGGNDTGMRIVTDTTTGALFALGNRATLAGSDATSFAWRLDPASGATLWQQILQGPPQIHTVGRTLAIDATGGLVVGAYMSDAASQLTALVARFDASGAASFTWTGSGGYVASLAPEPSGDLFVQTVDYVTGVGSVRRFFRLDSAGAVVWSQDVGATDLGCIGPILDPNSNVAFAINASGVGGNRIAKLDSAGNPMWSITASTLFGLNGATYGLVTDAQGNFFAAGSNNRVVRLDPNGNVVWSVAPPVAQWFELGFFGGIALAPNGNVVLRVQGHTPVAPFLDYDSIVCFDSAGTFLWSQAIRGLDPVTEIETYGLAVTRQGAVVVAGDARTAGSTDAVIVAVRPQSSVFCAGDGSAGPCPCGNESTVGYGSGCLRTGTFLGARLDDQGIASLGTDSLRFFASGLAPNGLCSLIQSQPAASGTPFQDGLLCLTGSLMRLHLGPAAGQIVDLPASSSPSIHALSASLGSPIAPGSTRGYQLYYRGGTGLCSPSNGNLSNGVRVTWEL